MCSWQLVTELPRKTAPQQSLSGSSAAVRRLTGVLAPTTVCHRLLLLDHPDRCMASLLTDRGRWDLQGIRTVVPGSSMGWWRGPVAERSGGEYPGGAQRIRS
jgi:hypothetical protein